MVSSVQVTSGEEMKFFSFRLKIVSFFLFHFAEIEQRDDLFLFLFEPSFEASDDNNTLTLAYFKPINSYSTELSIKLLEK